ncbi:hypothetical protein C2S52_007889 [Perilla frutescens var. hirtella]|nr:hypothetical protein C2S52_007889 [Perilla frutescens var. hirtella]
MTFAVALNPPGGITPDGKAAVMTLKHRDAYWRFSIWNTFAFLLSATTVMLLMCGIPITRRRWAAVIILIMWGSLSPVEAAYMEVVKAFRPVEATEAVIRLLKYGIYCWIGTSFLVAVYHILTVIRSFVLDVIGFLNCVRVMIAQTKK